MLNLFTDAMRRALVLVKLIGFIGAIALIRDTAYNGHDFSVFWNAARYVLEGQPAYSISRDGGMVFKYPPWILPFFFPLALFPLGIAKWIWGCIEVSALALIVIWLLHFIKLKPAPVLIVGASYWGIWAVHAIDGQVALIMLAVSLWAFQGSSREVLKRFGLRSLVLAIALSTKIFSCFPLLFSKLNADNFKTTLKIVGVLLLLSVPALWTTPQKSVKNLLVSWFEAAGSGGKLLSPEKIRGKANPGLPGFFLKNFSKDSEEPNKDVFAFLILGTVLGLSWLYLSRPIEVASPTDVWIGWLGLVPVVHPLPWNHLFVFSFPLAALIFERAIIQKDRKLVLTACFGIALITLSSDKVLGPLGELLQENSAKSWGVLICLGTLIKSQKMKGNWNGTSLHH